MKRLANKAVSAVLAGTMIMSVPMAVLAEETSGTATDTELTEEEKEERIKTLIERGESAGKSEAEALAERHAEVHFFSAQTADPTRDSLKSDAAIIAKYYLNYQEDEYRNAFLTKFKEYYPTAYTEKFISLEKENEEKLYERAKKDGSDMGTKAGSTRAVMDFVDGRTNSWQRAYNEFLAEESLDDRYFLYNEPSWYGPTFKDWFKAEFNKNYTGTYMDANMETATGNMTYKKLSGLGDVITFQDTAFNVADGSVGASKVKMVELSIPKAAFYNDTYIGIEKEKDSFGAEAGNYEPVTNVYSVTVNNSEDNVALREDLTLTFDYYGTDRVGIYEWADGKWRYLNTLQDEQREGQTEGLVSTIIPKGTDYRGGHYALFIDEDFSHFKDIQMSWAKEEIFSYLRRGYVLGYGDDNFRPERKITRGEFLIIASRIFDWDVKDSSANVYFWDRDSFGFYKDYVNYAASNGYVTGYPDGSFKPWDNISYSEIEWLMKRLIDDKNFSWKYFADIMKYDKYKYSPSNDNMNAKIMRDEAVFMFYTLEKQGKI